MHTNQGWRTSVWGQGTLEKVRVGRVNQMNKGMLYTQILSTAPRLVKH